MNSKIHCFVCDSNGYLTKEGKYYKVVHNVRISKGNWKTRKCHLGSASKLLDNLDYISEKRPDVLDPSLLTEIKDNLPRTFRKGKTTIENNYVANLIMRVFELSKNLGKGWKSLYNKEYFSWNKSKCPHCDQKVSVFVMKHRNTSLFKLDKLL